MPNRLKEAEKGLNFDGTFGSDTAGDIKTHLRPGLILKGFGVNRVAIIWIDGHSTQTRIYTSSSLLVLPQLESYNLAFISSPLACWLLEFAK